MAKRGTPETTEAPRQGRFEPFVDDAAVETIGGLSIENGTAGIAIHGSLDLTRDAAGLVQARALAAALSAIVAALEAQPLSEQAMNATRPTSSVKNPFA